jgi:hypothetical protein
MMAMSGGTRIRRRSRAGRRLLALAALTLAAALAGGCGTSRPGPINATELAEAEAFPFFRVYWVGRSFLGDPLAAADGLNSYISSVGDSVYYGDCVQKKGIFGGGSCELPLQVTTVIYRRHRNDALGPQQRNTVIRGVPAVVYDGGRSIELYSGRLAIDIFSDRYSHALAAAERLFPLNAPGSPHGNLPAPVYCPGLTGEIDLQVSEVMNNLPAHICQRTANTMLFAEELTE